jgi:hypothetical protein
VSVKRLSRENIHFSPIAGRVVDLGQKHGTTLLIPSYPIFIDWTELILYPIHQHFQQWNISDITVPP